MKRRAGGSKVFTWFEQHDGFQAGEFGGVDLNALKTLNDVLKEAKIGHARRYFL